MSEEAWTQPPRDGYVVTLRSYPWHRKELDGETTTLTFWGVCDIALFGRSIAPDMRLIEDSYYGFPDSKDSQESALDAAEIEIERHRQATWRLTREKN